MALGGNDATFRFGTSGAGEVKADLASLRAELDKLGQAKLRSAAEGTKAGREYTQVERDRVELAQQDLKITSATTKALRDQLVAEREIVKIRQQLKSGQLLPEEAHAAQAGVEARLRDKQAADAAQSARATQTALRSSTMQLAAAFTIGAGAALAFWGAVGDGAARAGRFAITQAAALEQQVDKAAAVMQGGQLVRQQLEDAAIAAGSKSAFSAVQAAEALEFLAMAGFNAVNATSALPGVLSLAAAGSVDLARAADIASNILTGYGFKATELSGVNDVLVGTFTRSNVSLEQLGESFKYVGPIAKASGQEFELMAAAIGKLGDAGIQGSQAGTTLRQGLIRLQDPPRKARVALAELGIQTKDTAGNLLQLDQILSQLSASGANVGQIARIFGVESSAGFAALIQQGPESLRRMADDLKRVQGLAAQIERAKLDNLNGQLSIAQGATETLAASLGKSLLPELTEVVKVSTDYLQSGIALAGVQRELTRTADEQAGSLSTLARDGLAVADAAANKLAKGLSATLYVLTALGSPIDTLGKKTGLWAVEAESAGDSARGLVDGLSSVLDTAALGASTVMPAFSSILGVTSSAMRTLSGDAGKAAEAIQAASDKRRAEEMAAGLAILKDVGVTTWRVLEGAVRSYVQTAGAAITAEDLKRAEEAAAAADKIALARADLRVAQAGSAEERARAEAARDRLKISQELDDGKLLEVEASLKLAKINVELGKKLKDIHAGEAKAATDRADRVELAQLELGLAGQTDERVRAQLDAERQMVAVRQQLAAGKLLSEEAAAKEAAITAGLNKSLDEIDKKSATQTAQRALRVELARMDLAISGETDKALRARMGAERELAELRSRVAAGDTLPEEEAARRVEIERKLQGDLEGLRREADDARQARLDKQLGVAEQAASGLRGALSGLAEDDPWTRAVAGLGEIGAAALQTTLMLQAMESAEVGAGKAFVGAMQVAGPAVAGALGKMGVEQRGLSAIKALFYGAEAVGQASIGNFVGAAQAGIAAGLHAAVAAGAGGGGGGGGGAAGGLGGGGGAAAPPTFTPRGGEDASQRQLARYIGQELDKSGAQGGVTLNFDFSGSMAIDSVEGQRKIALATQAGLRQLGYNPPPRR